MLPSPWFWSCPTILFITIGRRTCIHDFPKGMNSFFKMIATASARNWTYPVHFILLSITIAPSVHLICTSCNFEINDYHVKLFKFECNLAHKIWNCLYYMCYCEWIGLLIIFAPISLLPLTGSQYLKNRSSFFFIWIVHLKIIE